GKFACADFNIGKFLSSEKLLGNISMNVNVDGKGFDKETAAATIEGSVSSLVCNGYNYKNIDVKGNLAKNIFNGDLAVKDENLELLFNGNIDFSKSPTQLDFSSDITKANLSKLNIAPAEENVGITAKMDVNIVGNTMDDATGAMHLNDVV
ncbi:translocation/assembly module TamB, partial [Escherichia coli]|uniref:hypothetical protein n=1 Tax=Escherichia coli TaxID=562 RepID=UPI0017D42C88